MRLQGMSGLSMEKQAFASPGNLSPEEERELVEKFKNGDNKAYRKLKKSLKGTIHNVIQRVKPYDGSMSHDELMTKALQLLPGILKRYDANHSSGSKVSSWVFGQLQNHLLNSINESAEGPNIPRPDKSNLNKLKQAKFDAELEFNTRYPSDDQIFSLLPDWDREKFDYTKRYDKDVRIGNADHSDEGDDPLLFKDMLDDTSSFGEDDDYKEMKYAQLRRLMKEKLTPLEQEVVEKVHIEGMRQRDVALGMGLESKRVKNISEKWKRIVKRENIF